jgi:hypothetical protein
MQINVHSSDIIGNSSYSKFFSTINVGTIYARLFHKLNLSALYHFNPEAPYTIAA